ncbi:hypothetical protein [Deinococcus proteolyticus]|nr:hypothetical protein [Deinococcus proteolyticus]
MKRSAYFASITSGLLVLAACGEQASKPQPDTRQWLAGDSHIHSYYSPGYDY